MPTVLTRRPSLRDARLASGLVMLAYVLLHLLNHALGLVSLATAEALRGQLHRLWHGWLGTGLLYGAALTHLALAVQALWRRQDLRRLPALESWRLALGLAVPLLLATHLSATRWAWAMDGVESPYVRVVAALWTPPGLALQLALLAAAWSHACIGLHLVWRASARWQRWTPALFALAVMLPVLAALGMWTMGREIALSGLNPPGGMPVAVPVPMSEAQLSAIGTRADLAREGYVLGLVALLLARLAWRHRPLRLRSSGLPVITLHYPGRSVQVPAGWSVLEASRAQGIAHLSLCGGRARCSTCRVRVDGPGHHQNPMHLDERRTLQRVGAPPGVRLACQLRPCGDLSVTPLLTPLPSASDAVPHAPGQERAVAVLFVDLRRWSGLAERQWPSDLVYVLERYFALVGEAVREAGGLPNQFIGDSVMALFGLDCELPGACQQALHAAALIDTRMQAWSRQFHAEFGQPLDFGMGLHAGSTVVGTVGYQDTRTFTAVGEVVNTASRLQDHTKAAEARLVVSEEVVRQAAVACRCSEPVTLQVRGRAAPLRVYCVPHPAELLSPGLPQQGQ